MTTCWLAIDVLQKHAFFIIMVTEVEENSSWAVSTERHIPLAISLNQHQSEQLNSRHPRLWDFRKYDLILVHSSMNFSHSWENFDRSRNFWIYARPEYAYLCLQETNIAVCLTSDKLLNKIPHTHTASKFILLLNSTVHLYLSRGFVSSHLSTTFLYTFLVCPMLAASSTWFHYLKY
jgi:hypothetical protein